MLRSVVLRHFRGFEDFSLDLGAVSVMIGRNSSGKTSVLQAIRIAYSVAQFAAESEDAIPRILPSGNLQLCDRMIIADPGRLIALSDWRQIFLNGEVGEGVRSTMSLTFDPGDSLQALQISLWYGRNAQLTATVEVMSERAYGALLGIKPKTKDRPARIRDELRRVLPAAVFVPPFYGVTRTEEYRGGPVVDRALGGGDQSHIVRNLVARLDGAALERMNGFLGRTVGARLSSRTSAADFERDEHLVVNYRDGNGDLELSSAGAGLVSMVALWAALERTRARSAGVSGAPPVVFLLDEPEAHMHPRLQGEVGERIAEATRDFGVQLVVATHSVEMVNRLGRSPATVLVSVDRAARAAVVLTSEAEVIRELDRFCDLTPYTSLSFLASRRVLFHEGPSDWKILNACARLYFRSDLTRLAAWQRYVPIALEGVGNVSARGVLSKVLTPALFPAVATGASTVRAVLVRDRDVSRDPVAPRRTQAPPHLELIDVVWSRYSIESLFLDPDCLIAWLTVVVGAEAGELRPKVQAAIAAVDADRTLCDPVIDLRRQHLRNRPDDAGNVKSENVAAKLAREQVLGEPAVWQRGKDRAKAIIAHLRTTLTSTQQHRMRGGLDDLVESADANQLDSAAAIPGEIRSLLDAMVA